MHEAGERAVDEAGLLADRVDVAARQPLVDAGDDAVPVAQQEERHDRRDDDERQQVREREPARQEPLDERGGIAQGRGGNPARHVLAAFAMSSGESICRAISSERIDLLAAERDRLRHERRELHRLELQERQHQQQQQHEPDEEQRQHDRRRERARHVPPFEPVDHGIEEIGDGAAGDERQEDAGEQPQRGHEKRERAEPEIGHAARHQALSRAGPRTQRTR